jgi:hypothetical protein
MPALSAEKNAKRIFRTSIQIKLRRSLFIQFHKRNFCLFCCPSSKKAVRELGMEMINSEIYYSASHKSERERHLHDLPASKKKLENNLLLVIGQYTHTALYAHNVYIQFKFLSLFPSHDTPPRRARERRGRELVFEK